MRQLDKLWNYQQADKKVADYETEIRQFPLRQQLLKLRNAGAGTIEAANLQADEGAFTVLGTGSIDCWVTDKLSVKGLGSGKVYLKGDAEVKNRTLGTVKVVNVE